MANSFSTIRIRSHAGVLTITLNRPSALNAFNADMGVELGAAFRMAQRDDKTRAVVLTGTGRAFCAGQDLRELPAAAADGAQPEMKDLGDHLRENINPLVLRMRTIEKPVVAAINGVTAGAGVSFALAADLRICSADATFKMAFAHIGLVPDAAATLTLVRTVGHAHATELCMLDEEISAERALQIGLVNRVVDDAALPGAGQALAEQLAALPQQAIGLTKRALNHAWMATLDDQLEYEAMLQSTAGRGADHKQRVRAFLDKRAPGSTAD